MTKMGIRIISLMDDEMRMGKWFQKSVKTRPIELRRETVALADQTYIYQGISGLISFPSLASSSD